MRICGKPATYYVVRDPGGDWAAVCGAHLEEMKTEWSRTGPVVTTEIPADKKTFCGRIILEEDEKIKF